MHTVANSWILRWREKEKRIKIKISLPKKSSLFFTFFSPISFAFGKYVYCMFCKYFVYLLWCDVIFESTSSSFIYIGLEFYLFALNFFFNKHILFLLSIYQKSLWVLSADDILKLASAFYEKKIKQFLFSQLCKMWIRKITDVNLCILLLYCYIAATYHISYAVSLLFYYYWNLNFVISFNIFEGAIYLQRNKTSNLIFFFDFSYSVIYLFSTIEKILCLINNFDQFKGNYLNFIPVCNSVFEIVTYEMPSGLQP